MRYWLLLILTGLLSLAVQTPPTAAQAPTASPPIKVLRYAEYLLGKYDQDADGYLLPEEWQAMQGKPAAIDADGDGRVSQNELIDHIASYGQHRRIRLTPAAVDYVDLPSFLNPEMAGTTAVGTEDAGADLPEAGEAATGPRRYAASSTRTPSGLPTWFAERDRDGDGQLSLAEYIADGASIDEFEDYDHDCDGVLTGAEYLRGPASAPPAMELPVEEPQTSVEPEPVEEPEAEEEAAAATPVTVAPAPTSSKTATHSASVKPKTSLKPKLTAEQKAALRKAKIERARAGK